MLRFALPTGLATEVCTRLGAALPSRPADLPPFYRAWSAGVPFDSVAKNLALTEGRTPPGAEPVEVAERWLATGLGGTCWGHCAVLSALLGAAGIDTRVALDRMHWDGGVDFHSFVVVPDDGSGDGVRWALDPIHASGDPLPLRPGARGNHGVFRVGFDADEDRLSHWFRHPARTAGGAGPHPTVERNVYTLLSTDLDADDVAAFAAVSGRFSGIPDGVLTHRRCPPDEMVTARYERDAQVVRIRRWTAPKAEPTTHDYPDLDEGFAALGYTTEARHLAERAGLLRVSGR